MKKIIYALVGVILFVAVIATGRYGLSDEDITIYESALDLQEQVDTIGFQGFQLKNYPLTFFDGDKDYVLNWEGEKYHISERKPVLNTIVATAYPVEEHYEILVPTVEKMSSLIDLMGVAAMPEQFAQQGGASVESLYGTKEQIATIWHEAFHAYQLTNFLENVEAIVGKSIDENLLAEQVESNPEAVALFEQQAKLLEEAAKCNDVAKIKEYVVEYKSLESERQALLSEDANRLEEYYERVEGTACYIEALVYHELEPEKYEENYLDMIDSYSAGTGKYYKTGMAQCMILDKLKADWKVGYDFSQSVMELIYKELGL